MKDKLTKRKVESVAPGERDIFVWDTELPNFVLKVTPKGKRVYFAQYWYGGRRRRYTIGQHGPLTVEQARTEAKRVLGEAAVGGDPAGDKSAIQKTPSLAEVAERYLAEHAEPKKKPRSVKEDRRLLADKILPVLGSCKVGAINHQDIANLHHSLKDTPTQANRVVALLSKIMNLTERWGLRPIGSNPCQHIQHFKEKKRERYLTRDELSRLGRALSEAERDGTELPSAITAIKLLLLTGSRLAEVLELKWEYVDFEIGALRLPDSKTGSKLIPLGRASIEVLDKASHVEGNPYVCPGQKPGGHLVGLPKAWRRIRDKAGLQDVRLHDLRHSFASVGAGNGLGLPMIGALLGHRDSATTARYAHLAVDPLRRAANHITEEISSAMEETEG